MSNKKVSAFLISITAITFLIVTESFAAEKVNPVLEAWSHENFFRDTSSEQSLKIKATYYSNEYVEALIQSEAEKNLWTNDEMENYKYTLLKNLNLAECIPFHLDMYVRGIPMYAAPFDKHITLRIGKNKYEPIDYDRRFNFKILGARDGMVYFPRYDPKTGKEILEGAKEIRLIFDSSVSLAASTNGDIIWIWDLKKDRGSISGGKAADRLEADRLIKRSDKLKADREALQKQLDALNKEYEDVNSRIDELQSK
ncbi:MAG: hypothetical protein IJM82_05645 [Synergistaceae bacterium]|nr:hypothetical protein [Synergistaceae bacterium]MBQ6737699.1 hypothetical protein [Synergistaceae bacterium]MBQ7068631.1 hypothetical protein [Synergistaceae bacterium]